MKVLIVAESASESMSGEAYLPLYYFRRLLARGIDVRMAVHERVREELARLFPDPAVFGRIIFVEDTPFQAWIDRAGSSLPARVKGLTVGVAVNAITQWHTRKIA